VYHEGKASGDCEKDPKVFNIVDESQSPTERTEAGAKTNTRFVDKRNITSKTLCFSFHSVVDVPIIINMEINHQVKTKL
jgi:hypothetical protein